MSFAERLADRRKELGLTQQGLADLAGIHMMQVHRYESGNTQPSLEVLKKLAVALRVSADQLLFDEEEREPADDFKLHFEAAERLDPAEKEAIKTVLEGIPLKHEAKKVSEINARSRAKR